MTEQNPVSIDEVRALVAERHRYDEWLEALEGRREETPEHVFARVRGDYEARRSQVLAQLHTHAPALASQLADLEARVADVSTRMGALDDERAEAMLRHVVGEFDDPTWNEVRERVEQSLTELESAREALDAERDEVRELLGHATPPDVPAVEEPAVAIEDAAATATTLAEADASAEALEAWEAEAEQALGELGTASEGGASSESEEHEIRPASITDTLAAIEADVVEAPEAQDPEPDGGVRPPMSAGGFDRPSIWGSRAGSAPDGIDADAADSAAEDVFGDATSERGVATDGLASGASAAPSADAFDDLAFLRSVIDPQSQAPAVPKAPGTGAPQKTLRCTECGTMNLPTEWYCERCGGELAAF